MVRGYRHQVWTAVLSEYRKLNSVENECIVDRKFGQLNVFAQLGLMGNNK